MSDGKMFTCAEDAMKFLQAGHATITLVSLVSQRRYTYEINESKDGRVFFVSVMYGPDNTGDFAYIGIIKGGEFSWTKKSRVHQNDPRFIAFEWVYTHLARGELHEKLQVWHEGKCGRCGAKLTVPESIDSGYGPECVKLRLRPKKYKESTFSRALDM